MRVLALLSEGLLGGQPVRLDREERNGRNPLLAGGFRRRRRGQFGSSLLCARRRHRRHILLVRPLHGRVVGHGRMLASVGKRAAVSFGDVPTTLPLLKFVPHYQANPVGLGSCSWLLVWDDLLVLLAICSLVFLLVLVVLIILVFLVILLFVAGTLLPCKYPVLLWLL